MSIAGKVVVIAGASKLAQQAIPVVVPCCAAHINTWCRRTGTA